MPEKGVEWQREEEKWQSTAFYFLYHCKKNVYLQSKKLPRGSTFQLEARRLRQRPWIGATVKSEPYMPMNLPGTPGTDPGERKNCPNRNT